MPTTSIPVSAAEHAAARAELLARPTGSGQQMRRALAGLTDEWLAGLFAEAGGPERGAALIAVGGYGRGELSPGSDLDLVLLHRGEIGDLPEALWYPVWDAKLRLDHSVRTVSEARRMASADLKVVLGLLDARTIAGDDSLRAALVASVLADWRGLAARRIPELRELVDERIERHGDLAHLLEPDLKEAYGGLREVTILRAVAASWLTDVPHQALAEPYRFLLDVRSALHLHTTAVGQGRFTDRLVMQDQDPVAAILGRSDGLELMRDVSAAGRAIAFASDTTWYRVGRLTSRARRGPLARLRPNRGTAVERRPLADGVVVQDGEVVLAADAHPERDPVLVLRAAAAAAQAGLRLSLHTVARLEAESAPLPVPWPLAARDHLTSLLGAGRPAVAVWESLDQVGIIERLIPLWGPVRSAPQRSPVHRFTVDRHLVEAAVQCARFQREVARPDLLLIGALLHDIGKGRPDQDHSVLGEQLVAEIGPQMGFDDADTALLRRLVAHHLLLPEVATRRDIDDPATVAAVVSAVGDESTLDLLYWLTKGDAAATGPKAWNEWKAALVDDLVGRARAVLHGHDHRPEPDVATQYPDIADARDLVVRTEEGRAGHRVIVGSPDRRGLLAVVAGTLAIHRLDVRDARTQTIGGRALQLWTVEPLFGEPPAAQRLAEDLRLALDGTIDIGAALRKRDAGQPARGADRPADTARWVPDVSQDASVLEVRAHDRLGTLFRLAAALSTAGVDIRSARVESRGSNVIDTFYVTAPGGGPLPPARAAVVLAAVSSALQ